MGTFSDKQQSISNESCESELIARFKNGDETVFEQLLSSYEKGVYRLCYRFFNNEEDAMDAAQEVFLKIYKALGKFAGRSSFKTWVYRITVNTCITLAEKRKKEKDGLLKTMMNWWSERTAPTPEERVLQSESTRLTKKMVSEKISQLPQNYRMPVILKDIEGLSLDRICEILEIPLGTAKSRINRGRRILQDSLQGYYYGRLE